MRDIKEKLPIVITIAVLACALIISLVVGFSNKNGSIISAKRLTALHSNLFGETSMSLNRIEGNDRYVLLEYKGFEDFDRPYKIIYDSKDNVNIKNLTSNNININVKNSSFICHLSDNKFMVIDSNGKLYIAELDGKTTNIYYKIDTPIRYDNVFKYIVTDKSIFIMTRENVSKFNEKTYINNVIYEIMFNNSSYKKVHLNEYKFNDSDFLMSFVKNSEGDIGVLGSSTVSVESSKVENLISPSGRGFYDRLPTLDKKIKLIDPEKVWVRFLASEEVSIVDPKNLGDASNSVLDTISKTAGVGVSETKNIPIYVSPKLNLYSNMSHYESLFGIPNPTLNSVFSDINGEDVLTTAFGEAKYFKNKKYVCFFNTKDGLVGVTKKGATKLLVSSTNAYYTDDYILYIDKGTVYYAK